MSAATLAKVGFCFRLERLFPFDAGRRSDGEIPEDVFGLYFVECIGVLRPRYTAEANKSAQSDKHRCCA